MLKKIILIIIGGIALGLGVIGIVLPLLPTTPLLLLASFCFIRSSTRLYNWIIHHKTLGPYVYNYLEHRAISKNTKILALSCMWLSLIFGMIIVPKDIVKYILFFTGVGVSIYILSLKTMKNVSYDQQQEKKGTFTNV